MKRLIPALAVLMLFGCLFARAKARRESRANGGRPVLKFILPPYGR